MLDSSCQAAQRNIESAELASPFLDSDPKSLLRSKRGIASAIRTNYSGMTRFGSCIQRHMREFRSN
jgi:hypothetical protein